MTTLQEALHQAFTGAGVPKAGSWAPRPDTPCSVCVVLLHATPDDREGLELALGGILSGRAVHRALRAAGIPVGRSSIDKHRNEGHRP